MLVNQILNGKADQGVVTVTPDTLLSAAAKILAEKRIGTVVVARDGTKAEGILSERDIVRQLAKIGAACLEGKVSDYMTSDVKVARRADNVDDVLATMTEGRFRHMPVVEDGGQSQACPCGHGKRCARRHDHGALKGGGCAGAVQVPPKLQRHRVA